MIRDINKVYGEVNDPNTVLSDNQLSPTKYLVSTGSKKIGTFTGGLKHILYTGSDGKVTSKTYNIPNRYVGTDSNGNLVIYESSAVPVVAPSGRVLEFEVLGNLASADNIKQLLRTLKGPAWYEIEVAGAGGGGGGCSWSPDSHIFGPWGSVPSAGNFGAQGGYIKQLFIVDKDIDCAAQVAVGTPGQGGAGPYHLVSKGDKYAIGNTSGGQGGKSPSIYSGIGGDAPLTEHIGYFSTLSAGGPGLGINGGADGGGLEQTTTSTGSELYWKAMPSAGGGGANGPYGGTGASVTYWSEYVLGQNITENITFGGSGGAGGGLGQAGYGANSPSVNATYKYGGQGQGGGGGGQGTIGNGQNLAYTGKNNDGATAGGGGGGGGASRAILTNVKLTKTGDRTTLELIAGGGGGGAGASAVTVSDLFQINDAVIPAEAGGNNVDSVKGGGGAGGTASTTFGNTTTTEVRGGTGGPGYIKVWRCVE